MQPYILNKEIVAPEMNNGVLNAASASEQWSHCSTLNGTKNYPRSVIIPVMLKHGMLTFTAVLFMFK